MPPRAHLRFASWIVVASCASWTPARAQPTSARRWIARGALLVTAMALDASVRDAAAHNQSAAADRVANRLEALGRANVLVPALAAAVILPRIAGDRPLSDASLRVAAGYAAADVIESVLKPVVGRHRPSDGGGPWRFRPFQNDAAWHSFPSAHAVHDFAIAAGVAGESGSRVATDAAYALASLVGVERVYTAAHWTSDVVASAILATTVAKATDRALRSRMRGDRGAAQGSSTSSVNDPGMSGGRRRPVWPGAAAGTGPIFADTVYARCDFGSSAIVRAPGIVCTVCTTRYVSGDSWCTTVIVPSPFDAKTFPVEGSNAAASTPAPIGTVVTSFPFATSDTAICLLPHTLNSRLCATSIARPLGSSHGAIDQWRTTFEPTGSTSTTSFLSSRLM
jgi:membrane-associated phospholipid phosphatase